MNVSESPNLIANSRIRPRLEKSSNAAKTAARFVFAPASLIASLNSPLGISNVVFIYKIFAIFTSKSSFLYSLYPILVRPPTSALAPSDIRDPPSAIRHRSPVKSEQSEFHEAHLFIAATQMLPLVK
jgi:hypothetical protein